MKTPKPENEQWRPVVDWGDRYSISSMGRFWLIKSQRMAIPKKNDRGYLIISMWRDGKTKCVSIHRLMAIAFIPNPEGKKTVNHKNGIKTDNRIENLEWMTHTEQQRHKIGILHKGCGATGGGNKLTADQVLEIRAARAAKKTRWDNTYSKLAQKYGVGWRAIYEIATRRSWKYV
jgi:hypothetical protein